MKILLVIPPAPFLIDDKSLPFLGILSIATVLRSNNIPIELLDLSGMKDYVEVLKNNITNNSYDVIGFTVNTPQLPYVINMLEVIPSHIKKIAGGPHITSCYSAIKHVQNERLCKNIKDLEDRFDHLFVGDGEISMLEFLSGNITDKVIDADDSDKLFLTNDYLSSHEFVDRSLIDIKSYNFFIDGVKSTSVISQLGCPFNCAFCCGRLSKNLRKIRSKSTSQVIKEIKHLYEVYDYKAFMFYDDELNVNKALTPFLKELIQLQKDLDVSFKFRGFVKSELFTDEQAKLMKECGFEWLLCGFESADNKILTSINKKATINDNDKMLGLCKKHDIKIKALMSCGHPGESEKSILNIQDWLLSRKVDDFDLTIITPYPGSPYFDFSTHIENDIWKYTSPYTKDSLYSINIDYTKTPHYYKGIPGNYTSYVYTDNIKPEDLSRLRDEVEHNVRKKLYNK
jgi:radical SAM superfamily enzyme YgiQ (UPF0313 family)